jgi:hypothetical protein
VPLTLTTTAGSITSSTPLTLDVLQEVLLAIARGVNLAPPLPRCRRITPPRARSAPRARKACHVVVLPEQVRYRSLTDERALTDRAAWVSARTSE